VTRQVRRNFQLTAGLRYDWQSYFDDDTHLFEFLRSCSRKESGGAWYNFV